MKCRYWVFNGGGNNREVHGTREESAREGAFFLATTYLLFRATIFRGVVRVYLGLVN